MSRLFVWIAVFVSVLALGSALFVKLKTPLVSKTEMLVREEPSMLTEETPLSEELIVNEEAPSTSLRFVGDIMLDRNVKIRSEKAGSRAYPFEKIASWLAEADYTIGNLEGPVTDKRRAPEKSIDFLFDPSVLPALTNAGFDAFSQANNHALDQGAVGYQDSVARLRQAGFLAFGHQVDDGIIALATTTIRETKFAFLGWNTTDNPMNRTQARQAISEARQEADHVIAFLHWGPEYRSTPHANEVELAHWLIDEGVDVVIGGHPHWTQGVSVYKGKPILWSLGNFVFDQDFSVPTNQGLGITLEYEEMRVRIHLHPMLITKSQPSLEEGEAKQKRLNDLAEISDASLHSEIEAGVIEISL